MACIAAANHGLFRQSEEILEHLHEIVSEESDIVTVRTLVFFCMKHSQCAIDHIERKGIDMQLLYLLENGMKQ
ncbi:hypothetical protein AHU16_21645 [Salmonella enterica subsp. enterica serovar Give]|nr:hypothetical protein [Salmonella enterica subsp. enterica serovar Give]MII49956.1 DUF1039 domain-containing protein [Salmonella enterica subsp. enterica serovar Bredeney]